MDTSNVKPVPNEDNKNNLHLEHPAQEYTCFNCKDNMTCEFSYDEYNTKGDCLAIK